MSWYTKFGGAERSIYKDDDGSIVLNNESFLVEKDFQGKGIGSDIFKTQIETAKRLGIDKMKTEAVRDDKGGWFGYKIWPMLGYDGDVPDKLKAETPNREKRISELMQSKEGRDWWSEHGDTIKLEFDMDPDGYSMKTWKAYQSRKKEK